MESQMDSRCSLSARKGTHEGSRDGDGVGRGMAGLPATGALPRLHQGGHEGVIYPSRSVSLVTLGCWL